MDLIYLLILILLFMIIFKLSTLQSKLEEIERLVRPNAKQKEANQQAQIATPPKRVEPRIPLDVQLAEYKASQEKESVAKKVESSEPKVVMPRKNYKPKEAEPQISFLDGISERFGGVSIEELLFGNIILKIAIVAFILGIGLFLKYSIDKDWIPIWGRVLIGIWVGMAMLIGGIKMIGNRHKLFSEALFGGGIAVLYLSVFSAFALEGFKFIDANFAYIAMVAITILAGIISIRFDAKSTAIFGLIGGFATPFLLSTGSGNYVGLLSYMLMLNLGVLYISLYKNWSLLAWLAFGITALTQLATVEQTINDFIPLLGLYTLFFIIYSIVPFISDIKESRERLEKVSVFLFWANFIVAILSFLLLFQHYNIELLYYAGVTVVLAGYLLGYASLLKARNSLLKNLFYIVLAQSIALLLVTPAFIFSGASLTIVWAVESLMLLWIATKSREETYGLFGLFGFGVTTVRYLIFDVFGELSYNLYSNNLSTLDYINHLALTSLFVIGSLFAGYKLLKHTSLELKYISKELVHFSLFMLSFFGAYSILTFIISMLFDIYGLNLFSIGSMAIIALFASLFNQSDYSKVSNFVYYLFVGLLLLGFMNNILHINSQNTMISLVNFLVFMVVVGFIYTLAFKESSAKVLDYNISDLMLASGIGLLFLFLNIEIYHIVKLYDATATKFAITLLWVIFGISLFVYGIFKDIKKAKIVGTILIFIAILKAFFVDLANLDSIYRIVLFLILGAILFGLSYFYQSKQNDKEEDIK